MKALFCGLGSIGQRHLRNLIHLTGGQLEILAYRSGQGRTPVLNADMSVRAPHDELDQTYDIRSFDDLNEALAQRPDLAFITNPNALHLPVALAAARAGCHLFIEKPVSDSLVGCQELLHIVEENKLTVLVAYQFRFHPGLQFVKQLLDEGKIGQPIAAHIVNGEYLPNWHPYEDYRQTHPARKALGGGCLSIQTHEIDYAMWLFGMPSQVYAIGGHLSRLEVDVEDSVSVLLRCQSAGRPLPVHIHLDYLQRPPQRLCEVIGDQGKISYDYYRNLVTFHDARTGTIQMLDVQHFERNRMFLDELQHFIDCVDGKTQPLIDLQQGINSMKISVAAIKSLESGQVVDLIS
jgi:predicted dehydrogenase